MKIFRTLAVLGALASVGYVAFMLQDTLLKRQIEFHRIWTTLEGRLANWRHNAEILRFASSSSRLGSYYTSADTFVVTPLAAGGCRIVPTPGNDSDMLEFEGQFVIYATPEACANHSNLVHAAPQLAAAPFMTFLTRNPGTVLRIFTMAFEGVILAAPPEPFPRKPFAELYDKAQVRPWYRLIHTHTEQLSRGDVLLTGPYRDFTGQDDLLTLTTSIQRRGELVGLINIDLKLNALVAGLSGLSGHSVRVLHTTELAALDTTVMQHQLSDSAWLVVDDRWICRLQSMWQYRSVELVFVVLFNIACLVLIYSRRLSRDNSELRQLSSRDALTGLKNRVGLQRALKQPDWGTWVSVVMLDLDNFKQINDNYGHPAGDEVLRVFGLILADAVRETDYAIRMGGEEFMLILNSGYPEDFEPVVERVRSAIERTPIHWQGVQINVTVSGGCVTVLSTALGSGIESLIAEADARLYRAKQAGKNRIISQPAEASTTCCTG